MPGRDYIGVAGMAGDESETAVLWYRRSRALPIVVSLATIPAFYMTFVGPPLVARAGLLLYFCGGLALALWFTLLGWRTRAPRRFLLHNGLDVVIALGALATAIAGSSALEQTEAVARVIVVAAVFVRILVSLRALISPTSLVYVVICSAALTLVAGAGFYWLEPTVHSYGEGVWLAFVSVATVGYGDVVPTTTAARIFAAFIVLMGLGVLSLVTASIAAIFIGEDERRLRRELHHDIRELRNEVARLRRELQSGRVE